MSNLIKSIPSILNMFDQEIMIIVSWDDLMWRSFKELSLPRVVHISSVLGYWPQREIKRCNLLLS